ncbi:glycerophosphodiester phosphodiesterase [Microaerobacter geothermalis]|uniref:glycerophosphodiester phosphodiesterase n=1 Tax=Microaerobacter geothermalis TaxID=674972 RepID=UPI001F2BB85B|nr:glycerophosphodiester phosphodiesterase family protein [Microaerobacter geothermalis]
MLHLQVRKIYGTIPAYIINRSVGDFLENYKPLIIAHRGASGYAPENTIPAFQRGLDLGADGIELDIRLTKDESIIVIHDQTIDRTTNGSGKVYELTLEQIKSFDAGYWYSDQYKGTSIPTLDEVMKIIPHDLFVNIEVKQGPFFDVRMVDVLANWLQKQSSNQNFVISSFDHRFLAELHEKQPNIRLGLLYEAVLFNPIRYLSELPFDVYSVHLFHETVSREMVEAFRQNGIKVICYTVNETEDLERMIELRVDGIITNYPDRLRNLLMVSYNGRQSD